MFPYICLTIVCIGTVFSIFMVVKTYIHCRREEREWKDYMARLAKAGPNLQTTMDAVIRAKTPKDLISKGVHYE